MRCGVDDIDDAAGAHPVHAAEPDDPRDRYRIGEAAGLDDDGIQAELRIGELGQRVVEPALVGQAADAAAGDRRRFVDLPGDQRGVDIELTEVVDDDADAGTLLAQHVVEQCGLARTEVAGERDSRNRRRGHATHDRSPPCFGRPRTWNLSVREEARMTDHNKAGQAREGLIASMKGKAKEIFGAITGNDSLTSEGQLQQAEAERRREASTIEAVADAEARDARTDVAEAKREGAKERTAVNAEAAAEKGMVEDQKAAQKRAAQDAAHRQLAQERTRAELDAERKQREARAEHRAEVHDADIRLAGALEDHREAVQESASAKAEAARIRRQTENLNDDA